MMAPYSANNDLKSCSLELPGRPPTKIWWESGASFGLMMGAPFLDASFALPMSRSGRRLGSRWGRAWEVDIDCEKERGREREREREGRERGREKEGERERERGREGRERIYVEKIKATPNVTSSHPSVMEHKNGRLE